MAKIVLTPLVNLQNETAAVSAINANMVAIAAAIENTLSRNGQNPNSLSAPLDLNSQSIINLPEPTTDTEPVRYGEYKGWLPAVQASATAAANSATAAGNSATAAAGSAASASTSAGNASSSATAAANSASAAAGSATSAGNSATAASGSASSAATSATTATTQAGIATTQAGNASTSATNAANSASTATTQAGIATTQAGNASASATAAANYAAALTATSTTSNALGLGSLTFTTQAGKQFVAGMFVVVSDSSNPNNYVHGVVTSYSGTTLTINATASSGSGTRTSWNIALSSPQGPAGGATWGTISGTLTDQSDLTTALNLKAPLASPTFTGTPAAPTPTAADNSTKVATTAFVKAQGYLTSAPVTSVASKTGAVTLVKGDVGLGNVDNTADTAKPVSTAQQAALDLKANLASPTFTGTPSAPTPATSTNTTQIATTAFVKAQGVVDVAYVIDGGGAALTTGVKGVLALDFDGTIQSATLLADQTGSVVVDIWKTTYAGYPGSAANKITASAPPTLSSAQKSQDTTLTGWAKTISAGDVLTFNVNSAATITRVTLLLKVLKG